MRTWFAKVVDKDKEPTAPAEIPTAAQAIESSASSPDEKQQRRVIYAPLLAEDMTAKIGNGIRIKAQLDTSEQRIVLMVDQPVLKGYSFWCAQRSEAGKHSPLSNALFEQANPTSILIHEMNVTVTGTTVNEDTAQRLGQIIRSHLEAGKAVMDEAYLAAMPSEEQVREGLQEVIDNEINPGIAAHSGTITLTAVKGNTAYIKMGGGCQGCAASSITLRQGVETSFRNAVPQLGALLDETDHTAGNNPFFTDLPAGMRA